MTSLKLDSLPSRPGVYLFLDRQKRVIYVGKAKSLRSRVQSYFHDHADLGVRKEKMVRETTGLEVIATDSELEAFILEATLIKRHKPRYNIVLRDDKNYPYLCVTTRDAWPAVRVTRRLPRDGSVCFGPYVPASAMWETLAFIRRTFPVRTCRQVIDRPKRPCIEFQMGRCLGPCGGEASRERYAKAVGDVKKFLRGERRELIENLRQRMKVASDRLEYEEAASLRDRIARIEKALESQKVIAPRLGNIDAFGFFRQGDSACVKVLFVRAGMVIGTRDFLFRGLKDESDEEILNSAVAQFYTKEMVPPSEVLLPVKHGSGELLSSWLSDRAGYRVRIRAAPRSGKRREILSMATENAGMALRRGEGEEAGKGLSEVVSLLRLPRIPECIDCFDISTLSGGAMVGCRVRWFHGRFDRGSYKRFHIRDIHGPDDFAAMAQVVGRCYRHADLPDLVLVDGGQGQLEAARDALPPDWRLTTTLVAIAKKRDDRPERLYLPGRSKPLPLDPVSPASLLLQNIRDEAHRFAVTFHRQARKKSSLASQLESVPGIGKARRLALLKAFGSVEEIRKATLEQLLKVKGIDRKVAENLRTALPAIGKTSGEE